MAIYNFEREDLKTYTKIKDDFEWQKKIGYFTYSKGLPPGRLENTEGIKFWKSGFKYKEPSDYNTDLLLFCLVRDMMSGAAFFDMAEIKFTDPCRECSRE